MCKYLAIKGTIYPNERWFKVGFGINMKNKLSKVEQEWSCPIENHHFFLNDED